MHVLSHALLVLLVCMCVCVHADRGSVSFSGNISSSTSEDRSVVLNYALQYRRTIIESMPVNPPTLPYGGFRFTSVPVTATDKDDNEIPPRSRRSVQDEDEDEDLEEKDGKNKANSTDNNNNGHKGKVKAVALVGGAAVTQDGFFVTYLAGFKAKDTKADQFKQYNSDVSASLGFVISGLYVLQELDSNTTVLANISLTTLSWVFSPVQNDTSGHLSTITATGTDLNSALTVTITFLTSSVVGITNLADAVVTPKSIESVINITGYTLSSPSNSLALTFIVGSGSSKVSKGRGLFAGTTFASGNYNDGSQVFFSLSNTCFVNGTGQRNVSLRGAEVDHNAQAMLSLPFFKGVKGRYGNSFSMAMFQVVFPAGETSIVYDPTTGSGQVITEAAVASGAYTLAGVGYTLMLIVLVFHTLF